MEAKDFQSIEHPFPLWQKFFRIASSFGLFIFPIVLCYETVAQTKVIQKDTSFTVNSIFLKEHKSRPYISIAKPGSFTSVGVKKEIVYTTIETRSLHLDIYYPNKKTNKKYPGVLLIHGGGWKSGDKSQAEPMGMELANKGYVAVAAEYRLSTEIQYPSGVHDLKSAIRWMRANARQFNIDTAKIAALGWSAGGQLAALLGTTNSIQSLEGNGGNAGFSSHVHAIIDIDGILAFKHPESAEGKVAAEWLGGTYDEKPDHWEEASPLNHINKNTPPALFINSSLPRFHAGRDDMIRKMDSLGIYSEVHTMPDTPHTFWLFHPWFKSTVNYTVDFLNKVF